MLGGVSEEHRRVEGKLFFLLYTVLSKVPLSQPLLQWWLPNCTCRPALMTFSPTQGKQKNKGDV